jgi:hypothetical protein
MGKNQVVYLQKISEKGNEIARKNGLFYAFDLFIDTRRSEGTGAIGSIHRQECERYKIIKIGIYSDKVMADEDAILMTIFHEYCHFLLFYTTKKTDWEYAGIMTKNKIPQIFGSNLDPRFGEENFCETYSHYINGISLVDPEVEKFFIFLNNSAYERLGKTFQLLN